MYPNIPKKLQNGHFENAGNRDISDSRGRTKRITNDSARNFIFRQSHDRIQMSKTICTHHERVYSSKWQIIIAASSSNGGNIRGRLKGRIFLPFVWRDAEIPATLPSYLAHPRLLNAHTHTHTRTYARIHRVHVKRYLRYSSARDDRGD